VGTVQCQDRHFHLEIFNKRLKALEATVAQEGIILTKGQPEERYPLGDVVQGNGVWLWHDILASSSRLAGSWVWQKIDELLLAKLREADLIDRSRAVVDSASVRAVGGTGPNPADRRKLGSKHHLIIDVQDIPLAVILTAANRHDVTQCCHL
jgi:hypothetical protein